MPQQLTPQWIVVFRTPRGKSEVVRIAGGLHEAEAIRSATLRAPKYSAFVRAYRDDPLKAQGAFERTLDACLRAA